MMPSWFHIHTQFQDSQQYTNISKPGLNDGVSNES